MAPGDDEEPYPIGVTFDPLEPRGGCPGAACGVDVSCCAGLYCYGSDTGAACM